MTRFIIYQDNTLLNVSELTAHEVTAIDTAIYVLLRDDIKMKNVFPELDTWTNEEYGYIRIRSSEIGEYVELPDYFYDKLLQIYPKQSELTSWGKCVEVVFEKD